MVRDEPVGPFMRLDSPKGWRVGSDGHDMSCPYNRWASWSPTLACGEDGAPVFSTPRARANPSCSPTLACGEDGAPAFSTPRARANPSCSPTLACGEDGAPAFSITTCACKPQLQSHPRLRRGWGTHVLYYHVRVLTPVGVPPSPAGEDGAPVFSTTTCSCRLALNSSEAGVREPRV